MRDLSYNWRRVITAAASIPLIVSGPAYFADLRWFGGYDRLALALSIIFLVLVYSKFCPSNQEMEEEREKRPEKHLATMRRKHAPLQFGHRHEDKSGAAGKPNHKNGGPEARASEWEPVPRWPAG